MNYLDIRLLEAFIAFMESGSITGAAQMLGRSQSGVTRQIQDLEAALGFELLARNGRRVAPSERGRLFHPEAERHLSGLRRLMDRAASLRDGGGEALEIATIPAFSGLLGEAVAGLGPQGAVATHLQAVGGEEVVRLVLTGASDLGLCNLPLRSAGLDLHWAIEVPCILLLREDDPLAAQERVALRELGERRLITTANPYRTTRHVDEALRGAGLRRQLPLDTNTSLGALGLVRAGLGIALIEPLTPAGMPVQGLVTRPIDLHIPFRYGAVTATGRPVRPVVHQVAAALRDLLARRLAEMRPLTTDVAAIEEEAA